MICAICHAETPSRARSCSACGGDPVLYGRYRLESLLGRGGAGATFRARDTTTDQPVAVKELSVRKVDSLKTLELFERETRVLARLRCPDVPRYVDEFTVERPGQVYLYLVQELIDGDNLAAARLDERQTLALVAELCDILTALHGERPPVVHRDLKPSNLMRRRDGRLVVIDFGAVRAVAANSLGGSTVAGTFGYMAPEQLRGQATPQSDLYAVGATAVALLTGRDAAELVAANYDVVVNRQSAFSIPGEGNVAPLVP
ncbi:MAG: serine/threonine protein kinase, partial [Deltaproteobacteria bacterium]